MNTQLTHMRTQILYTCKHTCMLAYASHTESSGFYLKRLVEIPPLPQPFTHKPTSSNRGCSLKQTLLLSGSPPTSSQNGTAPFSEPTGTCALFHGVLSSPPPFPQPGGSYNLGGGSLALFITFSPEWFVRGSRYRYSLCSIVSRVLKLKI